MTGGCRTLLSVSGTTPPLYHQTETHVHTQTLQLKIVLWLVEKKKKKKNHNNEVSQTREVQKRPKSLLHFYSNIV